MREMRGQWDYMWPKTKLQIVNLIFICIEFKVKVWTYGCSIQGKVIAVCGQLN